MLYPDQTETGELAYNTFGFKLEKIEFVERLLSHKMRQQLEWVAWRFYLIDNLQFRMRFSEPSFFLPPDFHSRYELTWQLFEETKALRLYLLCTCIDALTTDEFLTFQDWLRIGKKSGRKAKYGVDDQAISKILQSASDDLANPDTFRSTAAKVYDDVYSRSFGNRKAFHKEFIILPDVMKQLLTNTYFISGLCDTDPSMPEISNSGLDFPVWEAAYRKWGVLEVNEKIQHIAEYYYTQRRNPYTHKANSKRELETFDRELDATSDPFLGYISTADVVEENGRYRIIALRSKEDKDESTILRLVVGVVWLTKLGYLVDEEKMENLRWYHNRRKSSYAAIEEIVSVQSILEYYETDDQNSLYLPNFPLAALDAVRSYLYVTTANEASVDQYLNDFIRQLSRLNELIDQYNKTHVAKYKEGHKGAKNIDIIRVARSEVIGRIVEGADLKALKNKTRGAYHRLNHLADRMWWPD